MMFNKIDRRKTLIWLGISFTLLISCGAIVYLKSDDFSGTYQWVTPDLISKKLHKGMTIIQIEEALGMNKGDLQQTYNEGYCRIAVPGQGSVIFPQKEIYCEFDKDRKLTRIGGTWHHFGDERGIEFILPDNHKNSAQ